MSVHHLEIFAFVVQIKPGVQIWRNDHVCKWVFNCLMMIKITAAVAQSVEAFALHAEGWVLESHPRQVWVVKTGSDSSTAKHSTTGATGTGPRKWPFETDAPCHGRWCTLKNPHCSMTMIAEYRLQFAALYL